MALMKAKHAVYGEVLVPKSYLRLWPDAYKPANEPAPEAGTPEDSTPEGVVEGARTRTTNKKEQS